MSIGGRDPDLQLCTVAINGTNAPTNTDVDGVFPDASFEEAAAAVTAQRAVMFAVAAVTTRDAHGCRRHRPT